MWWLEVTDSNVMTKAAVQDLSGPDPKLVIKLFMLIPFIIQTANHRSLQYTSLPTYKPSSCIFFFSIIFIFWFFSRMLFPTRMSCKQHSLLRESLCWLGNSEDEFDTFRGCLVGKATFTILSPLLYFTLTINHPVTEIILRTSNWVMITQHL